MQAVILAGGLGTRISEESHKKPKPMVEIGNMPILWHIMKYYSGFGVKDFVICGGYKCFVIKEFFSNYFLHNSDATFDLSKNKVITHSKPSEDWRVTVIDTGIDTETGGRIKRIKNYLENTFFLTYGDGLSNVNLTSLLDFHKRKKVEVTVTAVKPPGRFGALEIEQDFVRSFSEKPKSDEAWINGGFFVMNKNFVDRIKSDKTSLERLPLENAAKDKQLASFYHNDFWQPMDTIRERNILNELYMSGNAPWKTWNT